ncbi:hypothetical protein PRIPAC_78496, partial [Pristionchus pacificus]|uniref:Uncharacterized protein n=1 Tax=Pristionchus pacificus TaxID=54126 RepID=A0A2A6BHV6_PRIPA
PRCLKTAHRTFLRPTIRKRNLTDDGIEEIVVATTHKCTNNLHDDDSYSFESAHGTWLHVSLNGAANLQPDHNAISKFRLVVQFTEPINASQTATPTTHTASFNAFYLTSYVFDRNVLSKTSSSRQLSISARRLEESPNIITRERSHTVSYRATTPVPLLTRNSSCILLDQCESPDNWL